MDWIRVPGRRNRLLLGGAALSLCAAVAAGPGTAHAASAAAPSPALVAAEIAPAVQLVQVEYQATVVVHHFRADTAAVSAAVAHLHAEQANGELGTSLQAINDQWATELGSDPDRYEDATGTVSTFRTTVGALCTGWFATPTGYLVTAAHCVARSEAAGDAVSDVGGSYIPAELRALLTQWQRSGVPIDPIITAGLNQAVTKWYSGHAAVTTISSRAMVALNAASGSAPRILPAAVVATGSPYPGQDFALLKVSGESQLPSLALGDSGSLAVGDNLYIDGFPGTVTSDPLFSLASRLQPTFTDGLLSAFRVTLQHVPYLQTQAPAYHGNSGGPVLGSDGRVVGILIAGMVDPDTGQIVAGEQFVLPSSVLARLLAAHGVRAEASPVTTGYAAALADYNQGYYSRALAGFRRVLAAYPQQPYAAHYATLSRQQIAAGNDRTPRPSSSGPGIVIAVTAALTAAVAASVILMMRRRRFGTGPSSRDTRAGPADPGPSGPAGHVTPPAR